MIVTIYEEVENTNFTGTETRTALSLVDCLTLLWKHRLKVRSFKDFPAPTVRFDFNQRHRVGFIAWLGLGRFIPSNLLRGKVDSGVPARGKLQFPPAAPSSFHQTMYRTVTKTPD